VKKGDAAARLCAHRFAVVIEVEWSHDNALTRMMLWRWAGRSIASWSTEQGLHFFHGLLKADEDGPRNDAVPNVVFDDFRNMG
jgi:hypothetical protein